MKNNKLHKNDDYMLQNGALSVDCDDNRKKGGRNKRMKNAPHIDNARFLALLIRSFVAFSLIIILGVVAIFILVNWAFSPNGITSDKRTFPTINPISKTATIKRFRQTKFSATTGGWKSLRRTETPFIPLATKAAFTRKTNSIA